MGPRSGFVQTGCGGQGRTGLELLAPIGIKVIMENSVNRLQLVRGRWGGGVRRKDDLMRKSVARWRGQREDGKKGGKQVEDVEESARRRRHVTYESTVDYWTRREGEPKRNTCWKNCRESEKFNGLSRLSNFRYYVLVVCYNWRKFNWDNLTASCMENEVSICDSSTVE